MLISLFIEEDILHTLLVYNKKRSCQIFIEYKKTLIISVFFYIFIILFLFFGNDFDILKINCLLKEKNFIIKPSWGEDDEKSAKQNEPKEK